MENLVVAVEVLFALLLVYTVGSAIYNRYFHPYSDISGPFWASVGPFWYFSCLRYGKGPDHNYPLHEKYGSIVRITPGLVQIADPAAIETIYGPKSAFTKSGFYDGFAPRISHRNGVFEERDEQQHAVRRRVVAPLYTQAAVLEYEPCVDRVIDLFYRRMEGYVKTGEMIDMSVWLRKYTFDVVGEIFYGREGGFGFIRDNVDYNNWCKLMDTMPPPGAALSYLPYGMQNLYFFSQMLFKETRVGAMGFFDVIKQSHIAVKQRLDDIEEGKQTNKHDMLSKLLKLVSDEKGRDYFTILDVTAEVWTTIWGGADSTAIALTSIFYHLHKHPRTLEKLRTEIDEAFSNGTLAYPLRYNDCIKLPYLHAVIRESMRIHSSFGAGLPRIVPKGGAEICGRYFPGGYGVTVNSNAVNFDKDIFGEDSELFIPERWLRDGDRAAARMERNMLNFGYGARICIGRHITNTEMYKLIPTILRNFDFELCSQEWRVFYSWFQQAKGVDVKVTRRMIDGVKRPL